uniref:choice-of-anchor L domain-containing protein n=1 Tax=Flavobacterium sp. TaxID=239 RepID=UPI00404A9BC4
MYRYLWLLLFSVIGFGQQIQVTNDQFSNSELVDLLLGNSCTEVSNISTSSTSSVAYFNRNNSAFPIEEGIVIRNGDALLSGGPFTNENLSSQINTDTDAFLQFLSNQSGQQNPVTDVAFLQFDFIPLSNSFSFDFLFASNEYGEFQCGFSDVFAFVLVDLNTGDFENLAVVPNTNDPISVLTIRDQLYNSGCTSSNPEFFSTYNVDNPADATLNMRGHTTVMSASSSVIPNNPYRIRLVVGDVIDSNFDSAVFLAAGNFISNVDLGEDKSICNGDVITLDTGLSNEDYTFEWTRNDIIIAGETSNQLVIDQIGTYAVEVTSPNTNCVLTGEVTFTSLGIIFPPQTLYVCANEGTEFTFDLTENNLEALEIESTTYEIRYFASDEDFLNNIPIENPENYPGQHEDFIILALYNPESESYCDQIYTFQLIVFSEIIFEESPPDLDICFNERFDIDLTVQNEFLLSNLPTNVSFLIQYFIIEPVFGSNLGEIQFPLNHATAAEIQETIWVRVTNGINENCYGVTSFNLNILGIPDVDELEDVIVCSFYELPPLVNGNYFTGTNGSGTPLFAGDIIEEEGTYYIFSGFDENGCSNETDFFVTIVEDFTMPTTRCGQLVLEAPDFGFFYTEPNALGNLLPTGTVITESTTVYFYSILEDVFCTEIQFDINILPLPEVDELPDVIVCDSYTLPPLTNGAYFTQPNGNGNSPSPGANIFSSRNLYIYAEDENGCTNQTVFTITILKNYDDVVQCGPYTIPDPIVGGFFSEPNGGGTQFPNGSEIFESMTLYYYADTTFLPNCTADYSFNVTVNPVPLVDDLDDVLLCNTSYFLPPLSQGEYFSEPDRGGETLFEGYEVTSTQTIYINNQQTNIINGETYICSNETNFVVEIRPLPPVTSFTDIVACAEYVLPTIANGNFYTEPNAQGTLLPFGTVISSSQTIYIFNEYEDLLGCSNETFFEIELLGIDIDPIDDVVACGSYTLPNLPLGNYYSEPNGQGAIIPFGTVITATQTIYAYVAQGDRIFCADEEPFLVTIDSDVSLPNFPDINACEQYELSVLDETDYNVAYYYEPNGINPIPNTDFLFNEPGTYTIYVYATSFVNINCFDEAAFELTILPKRVLNYPDRYICVDVETLDALHFVTLESGLSANLYEINWYFNNELIGTGTNIEVSEEGVYTIEPIGINPATAPFCEYEPATMEVFFSSSPIAEAIVSEDFAVTNFISINILAGLGQYEFQLDEGMFQSEPIFYNVASGFHTITIRDVNGVCDDVVLEVTVINYPKFFTPNGDGDNDLWQINDIFFIEDAYINIFDRFGKLITRLLHDEPGWDGTFNGRPLPSTDYWFQVVYQRNGEPREFRAHFSMKR